MKVDVIIKQFIGAGESKNSKSKCYKQDFNYSRFVLIDLSSRNLYSPYIIYKLAFGLSAIKDYLVHVRLR